MTNQGDAGGPSLSQAPSIRPTHHNHHRRRLDRNHEHLHFHQHRRLDPPEADPIPPHIRSPPTQKLHGRQVVVVQTVSVVHHIDATGAVTSVETLTADPVVAPTLPAPPAGATAGLSAVGDALPSVSFSGVIPDPTDGAPSTTVSELLETTDSAAAPSISLSASSETLTSTLLSSSSTAFPTLSGVFNSSSSRIPSLFGNHTIALFANSTRITSSSSRSTPTSLSTSTSTKTKSSSSLSASTTTSVVATIVAGGTENGANAGAGAGVQSPVPNPAEPSPEPPSGLPPQTRNAVVGGVVGSIAGIAIIVLALLYLLKWRRQRGQGIMLLGDGDSMARGRGFSTSGPSTAGVGSGMRERSGVFAITSALAKLSGRRANDASGSGPGSQEKGFYRVSGRKLVSVLESGGDGYSDPHDSIVSGAPLNHRDSQAFADSPNRSPLQLGSPMRPVSGVPVFRDGPQRTAIQGDAALSAGHRRSAFPTMLPIPDSVGRSFASRDGSRGSGSRFMEDA